MAENNIQILLDVIGVQQTVAGLNQVSQAVKAIAQIQSSLQAFQFFQSIGATVNAGIALGNVLTGVTVSVVALGVAIVLLGQQAANTLLHFAQFRASVGGNTGSALGAQTAGGLFGFNAGAAISQTFSAANGGGVPAAAAMGLGVGPAPLAMALSGIPIDKAQMFMTVLHGIGSELDRGQKALAEATLQAMGLEGALGFFLETTPRMRQEVYALAEAQKHLYSQEFLTRAAQFHVELEKLKIAFMSVGVSLGEHLLPALTGIIQSMPILIAGFGALLALFGAASGNWANVGIGLGFVGLGFALKRAEDAINKNTDAMDRSSQGIEKLISIYNGIYGGGERARSAIPAAFGPSNGYMFEANQRHMRWGAYTAAL